MESDASSVGPIVSIAWPAQARDFAAPALASYAVVSVSGSEGLAQTIRRPDGTAAITTTTTITQAVRPGNHLLIVDFETADAFSSVSVATAAINVRVGENGPLSRIGGGPLVTIAFPSHLKSGALAAGQPLDAAATVSLALTALATDDRVVALPTKSATFRVTAGSEFLKVNEDGTFTGLAAGTATVVPTVNGLVGVPTTVEILSAPLATRSVVVDNNALIFDPVRSRFWVALATSAVNGNSVCSLDPAAGTLGTPIFVGSNPTALAISDDASTLYAGLRGAGAVRRVDLATNTAGIQFSVPTSTTGDSTYALDIAVQPGHPGTIALENQNATYNNSAGLYVFDDGIARPNFISYPSASRVFWTGTDRLVAYNAVDTGADLLDIAVDPQGATLQRSVSNGLGRFAPNVVLAAGRLYDTTGLVVDATTLSRVGSFDLLNGTGNVSNPRRVVGPAIDVAANRAYFVQSIDNVAHLRAFRLDTFLQVFDRRLAGVDVPDSPYYAPSVARLDRWGASGLAFRLDDRIVLIDDTTGL